MDPELEAIIQQALASGGTQQQQATAILSAAQARGISPEQLSQTTSLTPEDVRLGFDVLGGGLPPQQQGTNIGGPVGIPTGLTGAERALEGGLTGGISALQQGATQARADIGRGIEGFQPFAGAGQQAGQVQAALSGALGPEAQAQAFQTFQEDPGTQFLRERGQRGVTGAASALGGLGGGNVQKRLAEFNQGLALQGLGQRQGQLGQVAGRGLQAAGGQANLFGQQGQIANLLGGNVANLISGTGQQLAQGRTQFGRDLAGQIGQGAQGIAGLQERQGIGISDLLGITGGNLANLLSGQGITSGNIATGLGQGLAGTAQTAAGQRAGLPTIPGLQATPGILPGIGQLAGGIGGLLEGLK